MMILIAAMVHNTVNVKQDNLHGIPTQHERHDHCLK